LKSLKNFVSPELGAVAFNLEILIMTEHAGYSAKRIISRPSDQLTPKEAKRRARKARRLCEEIVAGIEDPSRTEKSLASTAANMLVWMETSGHLLGTEVNPAEFSRVARTASRLLIQLGVARGDPDSPFDWSN
jgi:hypothetical protein